MEIEKKKKIKLGIFVFIGLIILVGVIYFMGSNRGLLGDRIEISAVFKNVEGLQEGNNVRFSGIKVGVVKEVRLASDSTVRAIMSITENAAQFIKEDSRASIESEGLMGNKMVSISSGSEEMPSIEGGDELISEEPVSMESVMRRVNETAENAAVITENLAEITERLQNGKGPLGNLLYDSSLMISIRRSLNLLEASGENVEQFTAEINEVTQELNEGDGLVPKLLEKEEWATDMDVTLDSLRRTSIMMSKAGRDLKMFMEKLNNDKGALDKLLEDSVMAKDLHQTIINLKKGTQDLDEVMNTVDNAWLLNLFGGGDDK